MTGPQPPRPDPDNPGHFLPPEPGTPEWDQELARQVRKREWADREEKRRIETDPAYRAMREDADDRMTRKEIARQKEREQAAWARMDAQKAEEIVRIMARREAQRMASAQDFRPGTFDEYPGTLADSRQRQRPAQRYLIEGLLGVAHNLSIEAMFKTGKTTLIGSAAGALADGTPFLGFREVHKPAGPVGIWNCEMDPDDFDDYLAPHVTDTSRVVPAHLRGHPMPLASSAAARKEAVYWLRYHGITVWFIDSWTRLCAWNGTDPIDNFAVAKLTAALDEIKAEAGVTALAVTAHMPKAARTDRAAEWALGAQAFSGWVDGMWRYTRDEAGGRFLSAEGRKVSLDECQVFMDPAGRLGAVAGDREDAAGKTLEFILLMTIAGTPGSSTAQLIKTAGKRKADVMAVLRILAENRKVYTKPGPRNSVLWFPAGEIVNFG